MAWRSIPRPIHSRAMRRGAIRPCTALRKTVSMRSTSCSEALCITEKDRNLGRAKVLDPASQPLLMVLKDLQVALLGRQPQEPWRLVHKAAVHREEGAGRQSLLRALWGGEGRQLPIHLRHGQVARP